MDSREPRRARAMIANTQHFEDDRAERIILTPDLVMPSVTLGIVAPERRPRPRPRPWTEWADRAAWRRGPRVQPGPDEPAPTVRLFEIVRIFDDERGAPPPPPGEGGVLSFCREAQEGWSGFR